MGLDGGGLDLIEMVSQQPCDLRGFGRYIGHDEDLQGSVFHTVSLARKNSASPCRLHHEPEQVRAGSIACSAAFSAASKSSMS